jgi:hypothetical protein
VAVVASSAITAPLGLASAVAGAATSGTASKDTPLTPNEDLRGNEELVAHVKNSRTGEISLFVGHREVTIHDRQIAARLVRATR